MAKQTIEEKRAKAKTYMKEWHIKNKDRIDQYKRIYTAENPDLLKKWRRADSKRRVVEKRENSRRWRAENRERRNKRERDTQKRNPEIARARRKRWVDKNIELMREISRLHQHKRRAQKLAAGGTFTQEDVSRLQRLQKNKCLNCKASLKDGYHIDHITPLSRGGSNSYKNIQLLCPLCNVSKGARDPIQWAQENWRLL